MSGALLIMLAGGNVTAYNLDGATIGDSVSRAYLGGEDQEGVSLFFNSGGATGYVFTTHSGNVLWAYPPGLPLSAYGGFYARLSDWSGDNPDSGSSALNTWHQLGSSDVGWFYALASVGSKSGSGTLEIATDSGGSNVVTTATVNLSIELT